MKAQSITTSTSTIEYQLTPKPNVPTLLFLHGLGANLNQFVDQHCFFADHFQVLSLNAPGHGNSHSSAPFSLANCAKDVIDLLDALSIDQFHFVGNSMGGNIGYELLKSFSQRLHSITTFGTTAELNTSGFTTKMLGLTYKILPVSLIAFLAGSAGQSDSAKQTIKTMMGQINKETLLNIVPVLARFNYLSVIEKSQTPFLILKGTKDSDINKVLPSTLTAFETRGNFTLFELENAGHFANLDDPERFNQRLLEYLSGLDDPQPT